jgi:hypothetical protein
MSSSRVLALALGVLLAILLLRPPVGVAAATMTTHPPTATATPIPTQTPYPTYTPPATQTAYPSPTVVPSPSPIPQGVNPAHPTQYCTGLFNWCPDLGAGVGALFSALGTAVNGLLVGLFSPIEHHLSDGFSGMVAPFQHDLTYTPDIPGEVSWGGIRNLETSLQELAATLFFGLLLFGMFARYLEQMGRGDFAQLTSPVRRGVVVTGVIAGYPTIMGWGLGVVNAVAGVINGIPLDAHESAWQAIRGAIYSLHAVLSLQGILDVVVMLLAFVLVLLSVVVRDFGLAMLGALYLVGPLCLACFVSPYLEMIARAWVKMTISLALWPLGYSVVLKVIAVMLAGGGPLSELGGFSAALGALGLVLLLYKTPAVVGSFIGSSGAILGAVATSVTDAGIGAALAGARANILKQIPFLH